MVVNVILGQVELGGVHLAHRLHRDLFGLKELVELAVLVLLNGGEGVDSITSFVHFFVTGSVGSARPAQHSYTLSLISDHPILTISSQLSRTQAFHCATYLAKLTD